MLRVSICLFAFTGTLLYTLLLVDEERMNELRSMQTSTICGQFRLVALGFSCIEMLPIRTLCAPLSLLRWLLSLLRRDASRVYVPFIIISPPFLDVDLAISSHEGKDDIKALSIAAALLTLAQT